MLNLIEGIVRTAERDIAEKKAQSRATGEWKVKGISQGFCSLERGDDSGIMAFISNHYNGWYMAPVGRDLKADWSRKVRVTSSFS